MILIFFHFQSSWTSVLDSISWSYNLFFRQSLDDLYLSIYIFYPSSCSCSFIYIYMKCRVLRYWLLSQRVILWCYRLDTLIDISLSDIWYFYMIVFKTPTCVSFAHFEICYTFWAYICSCNQLVMSIVEVICLIWLYGWEWGLVAQIPPTYLLLKVESKKNPRFLWYRREGYEVLTGLDAMLEPSSWRWDASRV